jgi:hypothetical protein
VATRVACHDAATALVVGPWTSHAPFLSQRPQHHIAMGGGVVYWQQSAHVMLCPLLLLVHDHTHEHKNHH